MVKIRLTRVGTKNQPKYRVIVADEQRKRDGKFIEILGTFDPSIKPNKFEVNKERYSYWLGVGAQETLAVHRLVNNETAA